MCAKSKSGKFSHRHDCNYLKLRAKIFWLLMGAPKTFMLKRGWRGAPTTYMLKRIGGAPNKAYMCPVLTKPGTCRQN